MAGSDQSANLGGMLGQIAGTVGQMGNAYTPVMKAATKPRGDMNDPTYLMQLAEWARSNGDASAAMAYQQESRRLADQATNDAKALKAQQGSAAMGNIQKGMQDVLNSNADESLKAERMAALEAAAMSTAERYGMDGNAAASLGGQVRERKLREDTTRGNLQAMQKAQEEAASLEALEKASQEMEPEAFERFKKGQVAKGNSLAVKKWETTDLQYKDAVRQARENAATSGPLSAAELEKAEEFGISVEGNTPRAVRSAIMNVEVSKATQAKQSSRSKLVNISTIKSMIPTIIGELENYSGNAFWDSSVDDWAEDALDDPAIVDALAAFAEAGGTVEQGPEAANQLKAAILKYAASQDPDVAKEIAEDSEEDLINKYL